MEVLYQRAKPFFSNKDIEEILSEIRLILELRESGISNSNVLSAIEDLSFKGKTRGESLFKVTLLKAFLSSPHALIETVNNRIDNSQLSALLMAIYFRGMSDQEMFALVESMVESGDKFDFSHLDFYIADKHSTGGVGDKISFILAPILSSMGIVIPMIAGRGLAFTGGTIDKLESIPNVQTLLSLNHFR